MSGKTKLRDDYELNDAVTSLLKRAQIDKTAIELLTGLRGTATFNPPSIAGGANTTTTVTVTGAAVGDIARAVFSVALGGLKPLTASVTAANTVTVFFENPTGAPIDLASGTLTAIVNKI